MSTIPLQKAVTVAALVDAIGAPADILGDPERRITALGPLPLATEAGYLVFCNAAPDAALERIAHVVDSAVVIGEAVEAPADILETRTLIKVPDPRRYYARVVRHLCDEPSPVSLGIHPTATVAESAKIGPGAAIGPNVFIDDDVEIGADCRICGNVQIYSGTRIGDRAFIQANAVVGSIGQSYERDDSGEFIKMPHVAGVILGDDVQIGVCASIVRGTLQDTVIGDGSAIGNQANVGHNVTIGAHCHIGAGAIVCGSSSLGDEVWLSIGAIIRSVSVGDGTMVGAAAVVTRPVPADSMANGFPARVTPKLNDYNQRTGR